MALEVEGVVNGSMHAEKTLGGASRLEPLHFALSSSHPAGDDGGSNFDWEEFAPESPLEGDGFELPVPREIGSISTVGED